MQKYGFWRSTPPFCNAKRGFLRIVKYPAYTAQNIYRVQMYISEHTVRRRGRFIAPVLQSKPNGFNVAK